MKHVAAIACAVLASCGAPAPPQVGSVSAPTKTQDVTPTAQKVRTQIITVRDTSHSINVGMDLAVAQAKKLADQKSASEKELKDMWALLTKEQSHAKALWEQVERANQTIEELNGQAVAADNEKTDLRKSLELANQRLADAAKWQAKVEKKVAVYDWISVRLTWLIVAVIVLAIAYVAIRLLKPAFLP